ncbi:hypothetical protein [Cronobacter malonaticus]|uniref:hypothetical protein n=1 Tax=Cronobacter malonaticus TaxID=413503 RepID=UPI000CFAC538|nr:hypothetical protein [Cronobacter malonaticus]NCI01668.1 hypothetical protein [Cronobacter malonaticus]
MDMIENIGLLVMAGALCFMIYSGVHSYREQSDFKENGIRTVATVTKIKQVGSSGAGSPKCVIALTFKDVSGQEVVTQKTQVVSALDLMPVERDRIVDIYYKKENPKKVWLIFQSEKDSKYL